MEKISRFDLSGLTLSQMERVSFIFLWLALFFASNTTFSKGLLYDTGTRSGGLHVFEENGKVGLKDKAGRILIPATYAAIGWSNEKFSSIDNVVGFKSEGLWGLISISNKPVTPAEFVELIPAEGSLLTAKKKSPLSQRLLYGCINTSGKTIIPFAYDALSLSNMRAVVMIRNQTQFKYGLIDLSGKTLIPPEFRRIYPLGSLRYAVENSDRKLAIYAEDGRQVTDFRIDSISSFKMEFAIVYQNQRQGLIDRDGEVELEPSYREIVINDDGSIKARQLDSWFFLEGDNQVIKDISADVVEPLSADAYAVSVSNKIQLTDKNFKPLHTGYFSGLSSLTKGKSVFKSYNKKGLIDARGKILLPAQYNDLIIGNEYLLASMNIGTKNRWVVLDSAGKTVTEKHYDQIVPFNGKYFGVRNRNFWGAVNTHGKEFVACVHDSLLQQHGHHIVVKFKGKYGIINLQENWIVTPQLNPVRLLDNDRYFEYSGNTTFLKTFTGNIIYFSDNPLEFKGDHVREYLPAGATWTIDLSGIITDRSVQPENSEEIFQPSGGFAAIRKDGKYGFIDERGRLRIANRYEEVKPFSNGLAAIKIRKKWGFIDEQETIVVQPVYDEVERFHNGLAIVKQDSLSGLVDANGKLILPVRYDGIKMNDEGRYMLKQNGLFGIADNKGKILIQPRYDEMIDTRNGYVIAQRQGKYGVLTIQGLSTIPMIYDDLTYDHHNNQYMAVKKAPWKVVKF